MELLGYQLGLLLLGQLLFFLVSSLPRYFLGLLLWRGFLLHRIWGAFHIVQVRKGILGRILKRVVFRFLLGRLLLVTIFKILFPIIVLLWAFLSELVLEKFLHQSHQLLGRNPVQVHRVRSKKRVNDTLQVALFTLGESHQNVVCEFFVQVVELVDYVDL